MNPNIIGLVVISLTLQSVKCQNMAGLMTYFDGLSSGNVRKCPHRPHPTIKTMYIQSVNFRDIERTCAPGTEFDVSKCSCANARTPQRGSNPRTNNVNPAMTALSPPAGIQDIMSELFRRFQNQPGGGVNGSPSPVIPRQTLPSRGALPSLIKPQSRSPTNQMEQVRRIMRTGPRDSKTLPEMKTTTTAPPPPPIIPDTQLVRKNVKKPKKTGSNKKRKPKRKKQRKAKLVIDANKVKPGPSYKPTTKAKQNTKKDNVDTFIEFVKSQMAPNTETKSLVQIPEQTKQTAGVPNILDNLLSQGPPPDFSKLLQKRPPQDKAKHLQQGPPPVIAQHIPQGPPPDSSNILQKGPLQDTANRLQQGMPPEIAKILQHSPPPDFAKLLQQGPPPEFARLLQQGPPPDFAKLLQHGPPPDVSKMLQQGQQPDIAKLLQQGPPPELANLLKQSQMPNNLKQSQTADTRKLLKQDPSPYASQFQNQSPKKVTGINPQQSLKSNALGGSNKGRSVNLQNVMPRTAPQPKNNMQEQAAALQKLLQQASQSGNSIGNSGGPVIGPTTDPLSTLMALMSSMKQQEANPPQAHSPPGNLPHNNNNNNMGQPPANFEQPRNLPIGGFMANTRRSNPGRSFNSGPSSGSGMGGRNPLFGGSGRGSSGPFGNMGADFGAAGLGAMGGGGGSGGADMTALLAGLGGASSGSPGLGALAGLNLGGLGGATGALAAGSRGASPPDLTNVFNMQGRMTPLNMAELANVNHLLLNQMDRQGLVDVSDLTPAGMILASKHFTRTGGAAAALLG